MLPSLLDQLETLKYMSDGKEPSWYINNLFLNHYEDPGGTMVERHKNKEYLVIVYGKLTKPYKVYFINDLKKVNLKSNKIKVLGNRLCLFKKDTRPYRESFSLYEYKDFSEIHSLDWWKSHTIRVPGNSAYLNLARHSTKYIKINKELVKLYKKFKSKYKFKEWNDRGMPLFLPNNKELVEYYNLDKQYLEGLNYQCNHLSMNYDYLNSQLFIYDYIFTYSEVLIQFVHPSLLNIQCCLNELLYARLALIDRVLNREFPLPSCLNNNGIIIKDGKLINKVSI